VQTIKNATELNKCKPNYETIPIPQHQKEHQTECQLLQTIIQQEIKWPKAAICARTHPLLFNIKTGKTKISTTLNSVYK